MRQQPHLGQLAEPRPRRRRHHCEDRQPHQRHRLPSAGPSRQPGRQERLDRGCLGHARRGCSRRARHRLGADRADLRRAASAVGGASRHRRIGGHRLRSAVSKADRQRIDDRRCHGGQQRHMVRYMDAPAPCRPRADGIHQQSPHRHRVPGASSRRQRRGGRRMVGGTTGRTGRLAAHCRASEPEGSVGAGAGQRFTRHRLRRAVPALHRHRHELLELGRHNIAPAHRRGCLDDDPGADAGSCPSGAGTWPERSRQQRLVAVGCGDACRASSRSAGAARAHGQRRRAEHQLVGTGQQWVSHHRLRRAIPRLHRHAEELYRQPHLGQLDRMERQR